MKLIIININNHTNNFNFIIEKNQNNFMIILDLRAKTELAIDLQIFKRNELNKLIELFF